jgi:hypothetical protein
MLVTLMETTAEIILTRQQELIQDLTKNRPRHTVIRQTTPIRSLSKAGTDHRPSIFRRQRRHSGLEGSSLNNLKPGSLITNSKKLTL